MNGIVISVREAYRELESFFVDYTNKSYNDISNWLVNHKDFFLTPEEKDCKIVSEIFKNKHFRQLIKKQNMILGNPEADAFIIAKAILIKGTVVTNEVYKVNGAKIPNVCEAFNVPFINGDEFAKIVDNFFDENLVNQYYNTDK